MMRMFLQPVLGLIVLLATMIPAAQAQAPSEDELAVARELLEVSGSADQMAGMMDILSPLIVQSVRSEVPDLTVEQQNEIARIFVEEFTALTPETIERLAVLYAETLSVADMQVAVDFYRSEAGQRFVAMTPTIMDRARVIGEDAGRLAAERSIPRIQEYLGE